MTVKELRKHYNLTQKELSLITTIPLHTLQNWEQGVHTPRKYIITLLEQFLKSKFSF